MASTIGAAAEWASSKASFSNESFAGAQPNSNATQPTPSVAYNRSKPLFSQNHKGGSLVNEAPLLERREAPTGPFRARLPMRERRTRRSLLM